MASSEVYSFEYENMFVRAPLQIIRLLMSGFPEIVDSIGPTDTFSTAFPHQDIQMLILETNLKMRGILKLLQVIAKNSLPTTSSPPSSLKESNAQCVTR